MPTPDRRAPRLPFKDSLDPDVPAASLAAPASAQRLPYLSDLTDEQWERAQRLVGRQGRSDRGRRADPREIVNAIRYRWTTGCAWRMLPHDFPAWRTVYGHFKKWRKAGLLPALRDTLAARPRYESDSP